MRRTGFLGFWHAMAQTGEEKASSSEDGRMDIVANWTPVILG